MASRRPPSARFALRRTTALWRARPPLRADCVAMEPRRPADASARRADARRSRRALDRRPTATSPCSTRSPTTATRSRSSARSATSTRASRSSSAAAGAATRATAGSSRSTRVRVLEPVEQARGARAYLETHQARRPARRRVPARRALRRRRGARARSTATPSGVLRDGARHRPARASAPPSRSWRDQRELRELRLFLDTHGVDAASAGRIARALRRRLDRRGCSASPTRSASSTGSASRPPTRSRARSTRRSTRPTGSPPASCTRCELAETDGPLPSPPRRARASAPSGCSAAADVDDAIDELDGARAGRRRRRAASPTRALHADRASASARHVRALLDDRARRCASSGVERPRAGDVRPVRRPVARRHAGARAPPVDPHRRPGHRQDRDDARARRARSKARSGTRAAVRADRQGRAAPERADRRRRRRRSTACSSGSPARASARDARRPDRRLRRAHRRRGVDAVGARSPRRCSARSGRARTSLLVGDVDQLAPVGPGRVLEDLLDVGRGAGRAPDRDLPPGRALADRPRRARDQRRRAAAGDPRGADDVRDFFLVERDGPQAIFDEVCELAATRLPAHYGLDPAADVQVLAPMHKGPLGIDALNDELRARLNPDGERDRRARRCASATRSCRRATPTSTSSSTASAACSSTTTPSATACMFAGEDGRRADAARRRARHAAPRLRGDGPQGAGLAGARRSSCRSSAATGSC